MLSPIVCPLVFVVQVLVKFVPAIALTSIEFPFTGSLTVFAFKEVHEIFPFAIPLETELNLT